MPTDCAYRQEHLATILKEKTLSGKYVGTADMTAFTDRFPREPVIEVVKSVLGPEVAEAWTQVALERKFQVDSSDEYIKYSVGSPMGVYSSWAVTTFTLHALVEYSAKEVGFNRFRGYLILGDDVAIFDPSVYHRFLENINALGVQVSKVKSTESRHSAEMAKRLFSQGSEVTGFPIGLLKEVKRRPAVILEVFRTIQKLGYKPISVNSALKLMDRTLSSKASALISMPDFLGGCQASISDLASYEVKIED
jgi:hypothetical protein